MIVRLTHLDGKLPNLALMKLSHWHKAQGDEVYFTRDIQKSLFEPMHYDKVYASTVFMFSSKRTHNFMELWPDAIVGGTGSGNPQTVEQIIGENEYEYYDYAIYPEYKWSIGFTQRGCRLRCKFCVVPEKEGRPRSVNTIADIWRKDSPRNIVLLDNDFFGQPKEQYLERMKELADGDFAVNFNQGINIRLIDDEAAYHISKLRYYDARFVKRRLYTAWDNLKDEEIFFRGIDHLEKHGVPSGRIMAYMLIGYRKDETMDEVLYRFRKMVERGILPYPTVYNNENKKLKRFQRYVVMHFYNRVSWEDYEKYENNKYKAPIPIEDTPMFGDHKTPR